MFEIAVCPHLLQREQIAVFVMNAGQAIADKLLRYVGQAVAVALQRLLGRENRTVTGLVDHAHCQIGDAAVQLAIRIFVKGSASRIRRVFVNIRQFKRLAVVVGRVAAAMMHRHRMVLRYLIQIVKVELAIIFHLGVVEKIPFHPSARRRLLRFRAQFVHDAGDSNELDHERIADQHFIEQGVARRVIVAIDEPWHDGHLLGVELLGSLPDERLHLRGASHRSEAPSLYCERLRPRRTGIHRVHLGVKDNQIGRLRFAGGRGP